MGPWFPELVEHRAHIQEVVRAEEERFSETLARGLRLFEDVAAKGEVTGRDAFELATTYGFPVELTRELARERGLAVDEEGFTHFMEEHREISRAGGPSTHAQRAADFAGTAGFRTEFVGYEKTEVLTQIGALEPLEDGRSSPSCASRRSTRTAAARSPTRGSSSWTARTARRRARRAPTSRRRTGSRRTRCSSSSGEGFSAGDRVRAVVPWPVRFPTTANHTATHLLHRALQDVLGDHARQAGSAVRPDKLRFDFTHPEAMTTEQRAEVERIVNERVFENHPVRAYVTPIEEARKLGAMMLFGEKYGDQVRVVDIEGVSRELCGGTHVRTTAEIGPFVITSEGSVGAGHAAHRGRHLRRGVVAPPRPGARRRASSAPRSSA